MAKDFISDAEMAKLSPDKKDFVSDDEMDQMSGRLYKAGPFSIKNPFAGHSAGGMLNMALGVPEDKADGAMTPEEARKGLEFTDADTEKAYDRALGAFSPFPAAKSLTALNKVTPEMATKAGGLIGGAGGAISGGMAGAKHLGVPGAIMGAGGGLAAGYKAGTNAGPKAAEILQKIGNLGKRLEPAKEAITADLGPVIAQKAEQGLVSAEAEALAKAPVKNQALVEALEGYRDKFDFSKLSKGSKVEKGLNDMIDRIKSTPVEQLSASDKAGLLKRLGPGALGGGHALDNVAVEWAKKNLSDPRAAKILQANGM